MKCCAADRRIDMDQVVEVVDTGEVVELSLAELAKVGGGFANDTLS